MLLKIMVVMGAEIESLQGHLILARETTTMGMGPLKANSRTYSITFELIFVTVLIRPTSVAPRHSINFRSLSNTNWGRGVVMCEVPHPKLLEHVIVLRNSKINCS